MKENEKPVKYLDLAPVAEEIIEHEGNIDINHSWSL